MIRINPMAGIIRQRILDTYQAMSPKDKKEYDKKIRAEALRRRQEYLNSDRRALGNARPTKKEKAAKGKQEFPELPPEIETGLYTPARLLPLNEREFAVRIIKKDD